MSKLENRKGRICVAPDRRRRMSRVFILVFCITFLGRQATDQGGGAVPQPGGPGSSISAPPPRW